MSTRTFARLAGFTALLFAIASARRARRRRARGAGRRALATTAGT